MLCARWINLNECKAVKIDYIKNEWIDKVNSGTFTCYSNLYLKKIPIVI